MKPRRVFGSHLYNQIVVPLLLASVAVGIFATVAGALSLRGIAQRWVDQVSETVTTGLVTSMERYSEDMQRVAWLVSRNPEIRPPAHARDIDALRTALGSETAALRFDAVAVLDESGTVLASAGSSGLEEGSKPLGALGAARPGVGRSPRTVFARVGEVGMLVALQPDVDVDGAYYSVALARHIDETLLRSIGGTATEALCFFGPDKKLVACTERSETGEATHSELVKVLSEENPAVATALSQTGPKPGLAQLSVAGQDFELMARPVGYSGGEADTLGHVVSVVSTSKASTAGRTTTNLILIWSVVAVVALVGLGGWVARTVSEPLAELAQGARRIADGDFSTKVDVRGSNEIAQLGEAFNDMTDSLRDRSEALTKKVLELATLYEMSRALGSTLDMDELLGSVLDSALRIFDLDMGYVALRDKETGVLSVRAVRGASGAATDAVRSSMSDWVVREGRPLIFNPDPTGGLGQVDTVTGARAALCVPLTSAEGTIGSITVGSADVDYRFNSDDVRLLSTIANHVAIAVGNIELFSSLQDAYLATVRSLAAAVDAKDTYTRGHSDRVATYAVLIAERLGVGHEQRVALEMAAYLHDIGKIGVAEEILLKPGKLTSDEMEQMRHHPLIGANILKPVAFPWAITPIVRHHHEHFDGTGYPAGLKGEEIPLLARILTAADSYEAMTADRPYRGGLTAEAALEELRTCAGTQFDPRIVSLLVSIVTEEEAEIRGMTAEVAEKIEHEEVRAIFAALVDGVFSSFRRLGGPRLASNVEADVDRQFEANGWPFRIVRGRISFSAQAGGRDEPELEEMRAAMRCIDAALGKVAGATLVDHFYSDAYAGFSTRLGRLADALGLRAPC
jgi:putative nucleotidyltransferase with HDIG domain